MRAQEPASADAQPSKSPEATFSIHSLRPEYDPPSHDLYAHYLLDELEKPARLSKKAPIEDAANLEEKLRPRNIALTGSYGSGKSSILSKVVDDLGARVVSVSLSTLGNEIEDDSSEADSSQTPKVPAVTNAIQKEIVKQLLYREKPSNVPGSRYRRIESFRKGRAFVLSLLVATVLTAVALLTGATSRLEIIVGNTFWPDLWIYVGLFVLLVAGSQSLQALFHNRVWIEKLSSGPASISLTDNTESFFDRYLDEIVYFFEANPYDVVILEDLDRFNDPYIFETLRELNTLLNNSKQIEPKTITFVYAIKDSIFEQLGKLSINGQKLTEEEIHRLAVTNRTKFFDVVIPVVPFISHRNARDLLGKEMKRSGFMIEKPLLDLVSKHLVDMRLIKNVHNEFGIFDAKILGPGHLDELGPQALFAMVVYKNLNMEDFEKIKENGSKLDDVWADFRKLVNDQISAADRSIRLATSKRRTLERAETRATTLGDRLEEYVARLVRSAGSAIENATLTVGSAITLPELRTVEFWTRWLEDEGQVLIVSYTTVVSLMHYGRQQTTLNYTITLEDLRTELDDPLDLDAWKETDAKSAQTIIEEKTKLRDFLKSATMEEMVERVDLTLATERGDENFRTVAEHHLGKGLALDLVKSGFIDRNFSLYVSLYYDDTVTARARNYILHSVDGGIIDVNAEIGTGQQIEAMIDEVGGVIFGERSIYNIQLLDHLLGRRDPRLDQSVRLIAGDGDDDIAIREAYFASGSQQDALVARLAPVWKNVLEFLVMSDVVDPDRRLDLLDTALASLADGVIYDTSPALRDYLRANVKELKTLTGGRPVASTEALLGVLQTAGVSFESLADLAKTLRPEAIERSLYDLTQANLVTAIGSEDLALDKIRAANEAVFAYVGDHLATYLAIQRRSTETKFTISEFSTFTETMNELADNDEADLLEVVKASCPVVVNSISTLREELWPLVAETKKLAARYKNLSTYIENRGEIDAELAVTLNNASSVALLTGVDEPGRRALAIAIIASNLVKWEKRVQLAKSLALEASLPVDELGLDGSPHQLTGGLVREGLIDDDAKSFDDLALAPWPVKSAFIKHSKSFTSYIDSVSLNKQDFASLAKDPGVPAAVKKVIVLSLDDFSPAATTAALDSLADFAISERLSVGAPSLTQLAKAQVKEASLVSLIDIAGPSLGVPELVEVLKLMPERYRRLTTTGGSTKIPNDEKNLRLADRLVASEVVSSRDKVPSGPLLKVNLKK